MKKQSNRIPTILGVIILIIGIISGVFLVQRAQIFKLGASPETTPQDVRVTNVSDSSATISWITDKETVAFITWGDSQSLKETTLENNSQAKQIHSITITDLSPSKTYFFKINSDSTLYDNDNDPWQIKTGPILSSSSTSNMLSGTITTVAGQPAVGVLVYVTSGNIAPLSVITSNSGQWLIPLSSARSLNLASNVTK